MDQTDSFAGGLLMITPSRVLMIKRRVIDIVKLTLVTFCLFTYSISSSVFDSTETDWDVNSGLSQYSLPE